MDAASLLKQLHLRSCGLVVLSRGGVLDGVHCVEDAETRITAGQERKREDDDNGDGDGHKDEAPVRLHVIVIVVVVVDVVVIVVGGGGGGVFVLLLLLWRGSLAHGTRLSIGRTQLHQPLYRVHTISSPVNDHHRTQHCTTKTPPLGLAESFIAAGARTVVQKMWYDEESALVDTVRVPRFLTRHEVPAPGTTRVKRSLPDV